MMDCTASLAETLAKALHPSMAKEYVLPIAHHSLFNDSVLRNFMYLQQYQLAKCTYFHSVQREVTPLMRRTITQWMLEVCNEEKCSREIFPLAVQFMDRFLSVDAIHKQQLQILATACLFLAGKVKMTRPFECARLIQYTDHSVDISQLLSWELLVLKRLDWDIASLTAFDFIDQFMHQLGVSYEEIYALQWSLDYLVPQTAIDHRMAMLSPSSIAGICTTIASHQILGQENATFQRIASAMQNMTNISIMDSKSCSEAITGMYQRYAEALGRLNQPAVVPRPLQLVISYMDYRKDDPTPAYGLNSDAPATDSASTPTDINEVVDTAFI